MSRWSTPVRASRAQIASPFGEADWAGNLFALSIGVGLTLACGGFLEASYAALDCSPLTYRLAMAAALLWTAAGAGRSLSGIEQRLATVVERFSVPRSVERSATHRRPAAVEREALWLFAAVIALVVGLAMLMTPWLIAGAGSVSQRVISGFLWSNWTLTIHDTLFLAVAAAPFFLFGLMLRLAHRVACPYGRWHAGAIGWSIGGSSAGLMILWLIDVGVGGAGVMLGSAAAPCLAAAVLAAYRASPAFRRGGVHRSPLALIDEPDLGEHWPVVLRLAVGLATVGAIAVGLMWMHVVSVLHNGDITRILPASACMLLAGGIGWRLSIVRSGQSEHGIAALGMKCVASGIAVAAGAALFNLIHRASFLPFRDTPGYWMLWVLSACIPAAILGYTVSFGVIAVMRRGSPQIDVGASALRVILAGGAVSFLFVAAPLVDILGSYAGLVAVALALLAAGGILIIHEPFRSAGEERIRLAVVFGGVVLMTSVMPAAGVGWLNGRQDGHSRVVESWWMSYRVSPSGEMAPAGHSVEVGSAANPGLPDADLLDWSRVPPGSRVAVMGVDANELQQPDRRAELRIDTLAFDPKVCKKLERVAPTCANDAQATTPPALPMNALRWMRTTPDRYDFVLVSLRNVSGRIASRIMTSVIEAGDAGRLSPDGALAVILPRVGDGRSVESALARAALAGYEVGKTNSGDGSRVVFCGRSGEFKSHVERWSIGPVAWQERPAPAAHDGHIAEAKAAAPVDRELALADGD